MSGVFVRVLLCCSQACSLVSLKPCAKRGSVQKMLDCDFACKKDKMLQSCLIVGQRLYLSEVCSFVVTSKAHSLH